jgi:hypothetical protein
MVNIPGSLRLGNDTTACTTTNSGTVRYNSGSLELCNGTTWGSVGSAVYPCIPTGTGTENTCYGNFSLQNNTSGMGNSAIGRSALQNNTTGQQNIANGIQSLRSNTTGSFNLANGVYALFANTTGGNNIAN